MLYTNELLPGYDWQTLFAGLVERMKREQHLLRQRVDELITQLQNDLSVIAIENNRIVGHTTLWKISDNWYEIGSTFVCPSNRNKKTNATMYHILLAHHQEKNILATTTNAASLHIGELFGFVTVKRNSLPKEAFIGACICGQKKTGSDDPIAQCQLAWNGEEWNPVDGWVSPCHVRVVPQTFERHPCLQKIGNHKKVHIKI